ncbi:MAG: radical SAM protein, partial [Myxococcota bacterium]
MYVHFPYCSSKCPYCDFNSHVVAHDDVVYADAVLSELDRRSPRLRVPAGGLASVYFGGGTPSRWHPEQLGRVLRALADRFGLREGVEITVEANPEDVGDGALFAALRDQGVNRFSLGVQSFLDDELAALGRMHVGDRARAAVR